MFEAIHGSAPVSYTHLDVYKRQVLGLVENMSYVKCPDCGKEIPVFGKSKVEEVAKEHGLEVLAKLPIDPKLAEACDRGDIENYEGDWLDAAAAKLETL